MFGPPTGVELALDFERLVDWGIIDYMNTILVFVNSNIKSMCL